MFGEGVMGKRYEDEASGMRLGVLCAKDGKLLRFVGLWETYSGPGVEVIMVAGRQKKVG